LKGCPHGCKLADALIEKSSKDELAECARLLALNLAHYQGMRRGPAERYLGDGKCS
jgi:hypothetical protein